MTQPAAPDPAADAVANRTGPDYIVVYPLDGGRRAGTAADPDEDAVLPYQFTGGFFSVWEKSNGKLTS